MPKITEQYLGVIHGKMGPSVFKEVNGIPYLAKAPKISSATSDPTIIAHRSRFGLTMKLGHAINAIPQLKYFWKDVVVPGHPKAKYPINKIVLLNYQYVSSTGISDLTSLVPDKGFVAQASDIAMSNTQIEVTLEPIMPNSFINLAVDKYLYLTCVLHLKDPVNPNGYPNRFFHLISARQNINLVNPLVFNLSLDNYDEQIYDEYTTKKAFLALVSTDVNDVPLHYSNTFLSV